MVPNSLPQPLRGGGRWTPGGDDYLFTQKTADERSASRANGVTKAFRVVGALRTTLLYKPG